MQAFAYQRNARSYLRNLYWHALGFRKSNGSAGLSGTVGRAVKENKTGGL